jgi:nitrogen fixation/metabolism regulation signal transduction histidine kinase
LQRDLQRGLSVIENRAESLNRFVQAYRQLAQLPAPVLKRVPLLPLIERVVSLEIRLDVRILAAPDVDLLADQDQIEQLLINLLRNAVESAMSCIEEEDGVNAPAAVILNEAERSEGPRVSGAPQQADETRGSENSVIRSEASESLRPNSGSPASPGFARRGDWAQQTIQTQVEEPGLSESSQATSRMAPAFSPGGRSTRPCAPEVTIRATADTDLVAIVIEDNGPGLANPENLFVPLYTTKKAGSGVGLALARQIIEAHGGDLSLRNKPNHTGCIAEVRIPIAERSKPQTNPAAP